MRPEDATPATVKFHRIFSAAVPPMRGDKSALGTLPVAAYQYCEPVRAASAYGWYIFPPIDIRLRWNGVDVVYASDDAWQPLDSVVLNSEFAEYWDRNAPEDLRGCWPPFLTATSSPGIVQIWSGFLISTADNWSVLIGPPANLRQTRSFVCYEGIVETDTFKPCPLFVNIQLLTTDTDILIPRMKPLFQVRPVHRSAYSDATLRCDEYVGLEPRSDGAGSMSADDWAGYTRTVRKLDAPPEQVRPGAYGAARRKNARRKAE
jgi:hypothetical protein